MAVEIMFPSAKSINRVNTRVLLRRKNMELEYYSCELCIWQMEETRGHLFIYCNFAKQCWEGIAIPPHLATLRALKWIRRKLKVPFTMEVLILMTWCIWKTRNNWIFIEVDPTEEDCWRLFHKEFLLLLHRPKQVTFPL
jgi:hypothetical protein